MRKIYMLPAPSMAQSNLTNSINQIVIQLARHLPAYGYELTENPAEADLVAGHAGQMGEDRRVDVAHVHGLYPTSHRGALKLWEVLNAKVIDSLRVARAVTTPSQWVADILRRDMGISPTVIGFGINPDEWQESENQGYVLWAKTRQDVVCDPTPMLKLASACPSIEFVTTFGAGGDNVKTIGLVPFEVMKHHIQHAAVYLSTTKETWGIATMEAKASGVPILGFRHGANTELVRHGVDGYLVESGDYDGLIEGLHYCLKYRDILGANARQHAITFTWDKTARQFASVYDKLSPTEKRVYQINPSLYVV